MAVVVVGKVDICVGTDGRAGGGGAADADTAVAAVVGEAVCRVCDSGS